MSNTEARDFFQVYTPKNLFLEVKWRCINFYHSLKSTKQTSKQEGIPQNTSKSTPTQVGEFYDQTTDDFLATYGEVIQAFRTKDITTTLDYQIDSMGLEKGFKIVDAGCGVGGPAIYFAENAGVHVEGITISAVQVEKAKKKVSEKNLDKQINFQLGDYHQLKELFPLAEFDGVYFLESFGHSYNHGRAIDAAWDVLKPGGFLYIKDLFKKEALVPEDKVKIEREVQKINEGYKYNIADLYEVLKHLRSKGWIIRFIKTIDFKLEDFESLAISNVFQEITGIAKINDWSNYVFPVEFFEIKCMKPIHGLQYGKGKDFLQNLYYTKIEGRVVEELQRKKQDD